MPQALAQGKAAAHKNLKLDLEFFNRMLTKQDDGSEEPRDFDVYLMEHSVMPLLLQGLDALSRHVDKMTAGSAMMSKQRFNPLAWLAQYLLRNHPRHVKDHRTPMYEKFSELANVERGRRCLLRRRKEMEDIWQEMVAENDGVMLEKQDISIFFQRLDAKWFLEGALLENLPEDFSKVDIFEGMEGREGQLDSVTFNDFFVWFEKLVKCNDILRASAFADAERRQHETQQEARKAKEDAERRATAMKEALEQRSELEERFEAVTADMYIEHDITRIMNKGAVIDGVEEKEGGPPLQGEHIALIRLMLGIWGCKVNDDTNGDVWNDSALAAWQQWLRARGQEASRPVDKSTLRFLIDKDAFEDYLQLTFPVKGEEDDDEYVSKVVEVRGFIEDDIELLVEAIDEETGETMHILCSDNQAESIRQRLATATVAMPLLAKADKVSGRLLSVLPEQN
jgi:hypothetical protein